MSSIWLHRLQFRAEEVDQMVYCSWLFKLPCPWINLGSMRLRCFVIFYLVPVTVPFVWKMNSCRDAISVGSDVALVVLHFCHSLNSVSGHIYYTFWRPMIHLCFRNLELCDLCNMVPALLYRPTFMTLGRLLIIWLFFFTCLVLIVFDGLHETWMRWSMPSAI